MIVWIVKIVAVIALLGGAAAMAAPKGRLPLALRGLQAMMRKDRGLDAIKDPPAVSVWKRMVALLLVLSAALVAAL